MYSVVCAGVPDGSAWLFPGGKIKPGTPVLVVLTRPLSTLEAGSDREQ